IALGVSAVGFGPLSKRHVFVGIIAEESIVDGDTIAMGDVSLRIWGIDAPERKQPCDAPHDATNCADEAHAQLSSLIANQLVVCTKPNAATGALRESFGRPLVTCLRQSDRLDIGQEMVRSGCADVFRDGGT